jgi:hypothetical protein
VIGLDIMVDFGLLPSILDFRYKATSLDASNSAIEKFDLVDMGVAIRILFLGDIEPEIPLEEIYPTPIATYICKDRTAIAGLIFHLL